MSNGGVRLPRQIEFRDGCASGSRPMLESRNPMKRIAAAGNTEVPACLALRSAGFELFTESVAGAVQWTAKKGDLTLVGDGPLQAETTSIVRSKDSISRNP
jgi:hypothetical protein